MEREKIARIIRALLETNGCTEAEKMARVAKAREMMDRYQIDEGMAAMQAEGTIQMDVSRSPYRGLTIRDRIATRIGQFCDVKVWRNTRGKIYFFGLPSDVEFAGWLLASLDGFIRDESLRYAQSFRANGAPAREVWALQKSFILGCCSRINERLHDLYKARGSEHVAGTGKSLVVVKSAIVTEAFAKLNLRLGRGRSYRSGYTSSGAFDAGKAAGDRASFGRPINGGGGVLVIGRC